MAKSEIDLSGSLTIEIDPTQMEASLVFAGGGENPRHWTSKEIQNLIQAQSLSGLRMNDVLRDLGAKSGEKNFRLVIARGTVAGQPLGEQFEAENLPIPTEWADAVAKTLAGALQPEIFREIQVKVEREHIVHKKSPLPFLPAKEEKVKVVEKKIEKERVHIDPTVKATGFAEAGRKLGVVYPAKIGVPGKNLKGMLISPPQLEDPTFYAGTYITRKGPDLISTVSGIVRIGSNWIDIVPFFAHDWVLGVSEDHATCLLDFTPGSHFLPLPSVAKIMEAALAKGFQESDLLSAPEIELIIRDAANNQTEVRELSLSRSKDSFFDIVVSDDKLKAVLNARKGSAGGKQLSLNELGKAISSSGLQFSKDKLKVDIPAWFRGPERELIGYTLAEGKPPAEAPAQTVAFTADFLEGKESETSREKVRAAPLEEILQFPVDKIDAVARVEKDQRFATLSPISSAGPGKDVFGATIPGLPGQALAIKTYGFIEKSGTSLLSATRAGLLLKSERDGLLHLAVVEHQDGEVAVDVAPDKMSAYIEIRAHKGSGTMIGKTQVDEEIQKSGVKKGVQEETLEKVIAASVQGIDVSRVCFARGMAAKAASPSEVKFLVEFASGSGVTMRKDGTADYRNQDRLTTLKKDSPIAEIFPSAQIPEPGYDVLGSELNLPPPLAIPLEIGSNIRQQTEADGRILLVADADGELKRDKSRIEIVAAYSIKGNVDGASGNIKFPGMVQVSGDVMSGFYVVAGGEIRIGGNVEGSLLSSEKDILIQGGVKGSGKALLRTKGEIQSSFVEQATMLAVGNIRIKKTLLRSRIKCNSRVVLSDDARIIGGSMKVKLGLVTGDIGNASGVPTHVVFGQDVLVEDQIEVEEKEIASLQADLAKVDTAMKSSEKINDKVKMQELFNEKFKIMKLLEKRNLRLFTLKERFEQHFESEIIIKGTVYPGVVLESHGRTHEFTKPTKGVKIRFDTGSGRLVEESLGSRS